MAEAEVVRIHRESEVYTNAAHHLEAPSPTLWGSERAALRLDQAPFPKYNKSSHNNAHHRSLMRRLTRFFTTPLTSPRNSLSSSCTLGWSHTVISNIRSLKSLRCTCEYTKVWFHFGSSTFFTVLVRLLLLSLKNKYVLSMKKQTQVHAATYCSSMQRCSWDVYSLIRNF